VAARTEYTREQAMAEFREIADQFTAIPQKYDREQLLWRPDPKAWCMAECAEHVALTNAAYLREIKPAISAAPGTSSTNDGLCTGGWLSALLLKSVSPEASRKLKAPTKMRPLDADSQEAFKKLAATHDEILSILSTPPKADLNRIRFQNPFVPLIRFTVASGILIMLAHGRRHLLQSQRLPEQSGFSAVR
jgi:hypothetical protein